VRWRLTGEYKFHRLARFWTKIFAVSFAMGVVSGIVLSYQFGTNWSRFSEVAGNVMGPLLGYEVLTAFFLEATFLGIMLFGWKKVPPNLHVTAAVLVAVGTSMSAFWIVGQQLMHAHRPRDEDGVANPSTGWNRVQSSSYRFAHSSRPYLTTSLVVQWSAHDT
jgi:cytochrome d ubiquinol oxidase subunit I